MVGLSESYMLIYEKKPFAPAPAPATAALPPVAAAGEDTAAL
jgi:hypothetical protein